MATLLFRYRPSTGKDHAAHPVHPVAARMSADNNDRDDHDVDETKRDRWWYESSYDLKHGLEVDDSVGQTLAGDELDQLFRR